MKGTRVQFDSLCNEQEEAVFGGQALKILKGMYFEAKWGSPLLLFMLDGTPIGREYGLEENEEYLCITEQQQLY